MSGDSSQVDKDQASQPRLAEMFTPRIILILAINLLLIATLFMVLPFLVVYFHQTSGFSTYEAGVLVASPFLSALLFGVIGGYISDRIGIVWSTSIAMALHGLTLASVGFTRSFILTLILMIISGLPMPITGSGIKALLNEISKPEHRGILQNYLYWSSNVGVILGLLVSSQFLDAGYSNLPLTLLGIGRLVLSCVILIFFINIPLQRQNTTETVLKTSHPSMLQTLRFVFTDRALLYAVGTFLLLLMMESQWNATVPLYFDSQFSHGTALLGPLLAINGIFVAVCQPIAVKVFLKRQAGPVFALGIISAGMGLAIAGFIGTLWSWFLGVVLYSAGEVIATTKLNHLMGELPTPGNATLYFSTFTSAQNLAYLLGLSLGPVIFQVFTPPILFGSTIGLAIIATLLFYRAISAYRSTRLGEQAVPRGAVGSVWQE